ncbi:MAG: hypothetical protein ABL998_09110, partial [Planctomycetota bacterium]
QDSVRAELRVGGAMLVRTIQLRASARPQVELLLARGQSIRPDGDAWVVEGERAHRIVVRRGGTCHTVLTGGTTELRLTAQVGIPALVQTSKEDAESSTIEVEYSW